MRSVTEAIHAMDPGQVAIVRHERVAQRRDVASRAEVAAAVTSQGIAR